MEMNLIIKSIIEINMIIVNKRLFGYKLFFYIGENICVSLIFKNININVFSVKVIVVYVLWDKFDNFVLNMVIFLKLEVWRIFVVIVVMILDILNVFVKI